MTVSRATICTQFKCSTDCCISAQRNANKTIFSWEYEHIGVWWLNHSLEIIPFVCTQCTWAILLVGKTLLVLWKGIRENNLRGYQRGLTECDLQRNMGSQMQPCPHSAVTDAYSDEPKRKYKDTKHRNVPSSCICCELIHLIVTSAVPLQVVTPSTLHLRSAKAQLSQVLSCIECM